MREQPTLRDAIAALNQYHDLHTTALSVRIEDESDIAILKPVLDVGGIEVKRQANELTLGVLYRIVREPLGDSRKPLSVCLMRSAPVNRDVYRRVFDTQIQFDADFDGIVCRSTMLDAPTPRTDPTMARYVKSYVESIASSRSTSASRKVRELLYVMIPSGRCSAAEVAKELGVDRRTLHRHLTREGDMFSGRLTSTRIEMAKRLLENRERSLASVAEMLGFSALSSFMRWFRTHFGCTATAWRVNQDWPASAARQARHKTVFATTRDHKPRRPANVRRTGRRGIEKVPEAVVRACCGILLVRSPEKRAVVHPLGLDELELTPKVGADEREHQATLGTVIVQYAVAKDRP